MFEKSIPLMEQGIDVIHLEVGRPGFDTPQNVKAAAVRALEDGKVHYGEFSGETVLRDAICKRLSENNAIDYSADEILVTNGATHAAYTILTAAIDEGDEVILLEPYYPQHTNKIELSGGRVVTAPLDAANNYAIDAEAIKAKISDRTRMIILVNPANPTGRVFSREELQALADVAIENDLLVMTDEVYERLVFDGREHISIASLPGMRERTLSIFAFTKTYAMDGWRVGYIAAARSFMPALLKITTNDVSHVNTFIQDGAAEALSGSQENVTEMTAEYDRLRKMTCDRLNAMKGVRCGYPEGTMYAFPDITGTGKSSQEIADYLLMNAHVGVEAGTFYGARGEGHLRVCFGAEPPERIEQGLDRIATALASFANE